MKRWRTSLLLLGGGAALAFAIPAAGQRDAPPESLLPPGFGEQPQAPPPRPEEPPANGADTAAPPVAPGADQPVAATGPAEAGIAAVATAEALPPETPVETRPAIEIPEASRRPTDVVGPLRPGNWGLGYGEFGGANGVFLASLMRRLDAPLPSRWTSILLRRALLSEIPAPAQVNDVDWIAERAWLLLRMGEADGARMLVQAVDVDRYTPRMFTVAVQVALATADPAALCPLVGPGRSVSDEAVWPLADAMCAALQGDSARASQLIEQARRGSGAGGIDLLLAEKVIGAGLNTRRAVTVQWDGVDSVNSWRFGLAAATGLAIPDTLMNGAGPQVWAWEARAAMIPLDQRLAAAETAARLGVFSHDSLVEIYSLIADQTDPSDIEGTVGGRLRRAYTAGSVEDRVKAMTGLWDDKDVVAGRYARLILTAAAAARVPPSADRESQAGDLVASMASGGLDVAAARWAGVVGGMGNDGDRAWSILAVAAPRPAVDTAPRRVQAFVDRAGGQRGKLLVAALAGLGRLDDPAALGVDPAPRSRWSHMIQAAARTGQPGTVALLAAVGMQTSDWRGVPPEHLYQIVAALRRVGLDYEARMIAAEAMSRL
ncbi:MAG: hypothetical protein JOZ90_12195 [Alphaproteobacteria bacterium]|nr:hypothetical protein [Alphaproteobacteria bacterium]MBV9371370.1 hypothetical protein [Alphaproteobacteria bacterium]MBV9901834.1 hypothetical protein [Alphaproteobacteria bacterium]